MALFCQLLFLTLFAQRVIAEVMVTGNTYGSGQCSAAPPAQDAGLCVTPFDLGPDNVLLSVLPNLQTNTIRGITPGKLPKSATSFGPEVRAPVYEFVQSPDLVKDPLPFRLLLVRELLHQDGLFALDGPESSARDSWFPGFKWSVLLCVNEQTGAVRQLGWKFTPVVQHVAGGRGEKTHGHRNTSDQSFYAVIVEHLPEREDGEAANKIASPVTEGVRLRSKTAVASEEQLLDHEKFLHQVHPPISALQIAPRQPEAWMLAAYSMLAAASAGGSGLR